MAIISERKQLVNELETELAKVQTARSNLGYIELPKPIRDGWFKTLRLRDDIMRSKIAKIYQEVLAAVAVDIWGSEKKYADKNWIHFFKRPCKRYLLPGIKRLDEKEFSKLSSRAKKCFFKRDMVRSNPYIYACTIPRHYFINAYNRAYIDKYKIRSPILDSREQEIREILGRPTLRCHSRYYGDNYRDYSKNAKKERRKVKMELLEEC